MNDINNFATDKLLDFIDAVHVRLSQILRDEFGDEWIELGVRKHCAPKNLDRVEKMLRSPMRVVEMDKRDDEIYGVEHLGSIICGNWRVFKQVFDNRNRTEACLDEIKELRHNLAHRRKRHSLLRPNLIRVLGSCQIILSGLKSPAANTFADIVDSLSSGGTPWGGTLDGQLPPKDEMYSEFVDRPSQIEGLSEWLASDSPQVLVWGYGGVGKSALAYKFARDVRESGNEDLMAVCWVSAKKSEFSEGSTQPKRADFDDLDNFLVALMRSLYGDVEFSGKPTTDSVISELREMPILLVVDDFDTISEDVELTEFILYSLRMTPTRVIHTSRHRLPGMNNLEVPPFNKRELENFILQRCHVYNVDHNAFINRLNAIESVTSGYPLFVDDLVRHASFFGIDQALSDWGQRQGDAARQYALQRQVEYLSISSSSDVLIALAAADRALKIVEISAVAGLTDDDAAAGIEELLKWRMVQDVIEDDSGTPAFRMNKNTNRLVEQTFRNDGRFTTYHDAFRALTGERVPEAMRAAIGRIISKTKTLERGGGFINAKNFLVDNMTGELANSADLYGNLGWLYSRQPIRENASMARDAFQMSHRLGASKVDIYNDWASLERNIAEDMIFLNALPNSNDDDIAAQWKKSEDVAVMGLDRCGPSQLLCYVAGYGASREAKSKQRARSFSYADAAYLRSITWYKQALTAPVSDVFSAPVGAIYRGLALAYEGVEDFDNLMQTLKSWRASTGTDYHFASELERLVGSHRQLRAMPDVTAML